MIYLILGLFSLTLSLQIRNLTTCNCTQYTTLNDCSRGNCTWINSTSTCQPFNCTAVQSYQNCINQNTCAWVNNSCNYFTLCTDYSSNSNATCEVQGYGCFTTSTANGTGFNCGQLVQNYMVVSPLYDCTSLTQSLCTTYSYCMYMNNMCMSLTCSMATQQQCTYTYLGDYRVMSLCQWTGSKCQDAPNTNFLTADTCMTQTSGYYYWDTPSSSCKSCSGVQASSQLLFILLQVLMILY